ncbi:cytochrome-c oxidase, cbb3-type subunit II, partial [bacterium]|nr:cytochrome-c oxidase, cbb3-type subunit II [bacterium]
IMFYNVMRTIKGVPKADLEDEEVQAPSLASLAPPVAKPTSYWHHFLEGKPMTFVILVVIVAGVGGMIEIGPLLMPKSYVPLHASAAVPYTPLELEGRDIYLREGCMNCHSQMIRPLRDEVLRYGDYSKPGESEYEHPFQWGSRRIGPDLARVGGKYPDHWHYLHFMDPRSTSPGSIMPPYPWLLENKLDVSKTKAKMKAMKLLRVPYSTEEIANAGDDLRRQAQTIAANLEKEGYADMADKEVVAIIAYLQRLGKHPEPLFASAP